MTRYTGVRFRMWAEIADFTFDVVQWVADFEPNNIPKGSIMVPVGRGYKGNRHKTAEIHNAVNDLRVQVDAKVFLEVEQLASSPGDAEGWPAGEFVVFEGKAVGTGWRRGESGAQFIIYLLHWLSDLHYSSAVSATSHPLNPKDLGFDASQGDQLPVGAGAGQPGLWCAISGGDSIIKAANIENDLWGEVLQPWMLVIADQDRINRTQLGQGGGDDDGGDGVKNDSAKKALERIIPEADDADTCYVPSAVEAKGVNPSLIADNMQMAILLDTYEQWLNTTLWGKLVGQWVPAFFLMLVPRVENALVVPFTAGLRSEYKTLNGREYNFANVESSMPRVPRAVGIFHTIKQSAGGDLGFGGHAAPLGLVGYFESGPDDGLVILKDAPRWLSDDVHAWRKSKESTGADGNTIGTTDHPGEGADEEEPKAADTRESMTPLLDAFAQHWYVTEMLKGRHGEMSGKLRFDIAPGSTVKIEAAREAFIPNDGLGTNMWGTVMRVSQQINAESQTAGTAFSIAHIRNEAENGDDKTSIDKPPFYKEAYKGCSLVDGF